ncbi:MAG TPA: hypothetical protein PLF31_01120 [Candidatus Paceibacterota bacterium]|nr:hypothetical protein [Candidatus Paceibacterota bacterium]
MLKRWNRLTLKWIKDNEYRSTGISQLGADCGNYVLHKLTATSYPGSYGQIEIHVGCLFGKKLHEKDITFLSSLIHKVLQETSGQVTHSMDNPGLFTFHFVVSDNHGFSKRAIKIVRSILREFRIDDFNNSTLTNFHFEQLTFVKVKGDWIQLDVLIRMNNGLPCIPRKVVIPQRPRKFLPI